MNLDLGTLESLKYLRFLLLSSLQQLPLLSLRNLRALLVSSGLTKCNLCTLNKKIERWPQPRLQDDYSSSCCILTLCLLYRQELLGFCREWGGDEVLLGLLVCQTVAIYHSVITLHLLFYSTNIYLHKCSINERDKDDNNLPLPSKAYCLASADYV